MRRLAGFLIGADPVGLYYGLLDECLQAAALRLEAAQRFAAPR